MFNFLPVLVMLLSMGMTTYGGKIAGMTNNFGAMSENNEPVFETAAVQNPVEITISAAGDCTIGYDMDSGYGGSYNEYIDRYGLQYPFKNVADIFKEDDVTFVNLETTFTNASKKAVKEFRFRGKPEYAKILSLSSIEAVNMANNHTHDYLEAGYNDTIACLQDEGIGFFGNGFKYTKEVKGVKIGFLGYTGWSDSSEMKRKIHDDITDLKKTCGIVTVSFHWGEMYDKYPCLVQQDLGRFCIDSGADLVIGHHPHIIQGIEKYKGRAIVYSLGNFSYGGHRNPPDKDTFIFRQKFRLEGKNMRLVETKIIPCSISSVKGYNNYQPTPLYGSDYGRVINRLKALSTQLKYGYNFKIEN